MLALLADATAQVADGQFIPSPDFASLFEVSGPGVRMALFLRKDDIVFLSTVAPPSVRFLSTFAPPRIAISNIFVLSRLPFTVSLKIVFEGRYLALRVVFPKRCLNRAGFIHLASITKQFLRYWVYREFSVLCLEPLGFRVLR